MHDNITAAIAAARTGAQLDAIARDITAAWGTGTLADDAFTAWYGAIHRRRAELRERRDRPPALPLQGGGGLAPPPRRSIFPERKPQRGPDRRRSIERRRRLAASGPMPPALASRFTTGEQAVLRIVADEVREHGMCDCSLAEIAARAGVCRTLAKRALRG